MADKQENKADSKEKQKTDSASNDSKEKQDSKDGSKSKYLIKVKNLKKRFGKKEILKNINLEIKNGEIFGIIGMSGSGKTVLLKTLVRFFKPDSGQVEYGEVNPNKISFRKFFGFSTQESCFYPELTVRENLAHFGKLYGIRGKALKEKIRQLSEMLELKDSIDKKALQLSGGMQKRLDIACSLIHEPKLLILDEPTLELDPILRREIMKLIHKINEKGVTIIMASHLLGGIEALSHNVAIMHEGEIIKIDSPLKLRETYGKNEEVHLKTYPGDYKKIAERLNNHKARLSINSIIHHGHSMLITCGDSEKLLQHLLTDLKGMKEDIIDVHASKPSLTEIFTRMIQEKRKEIPSPAQLTQQPIKK